MAVKKLRGILQDAIGEWKTLYLNECQGIHTVIPEFRATLTQGNSGHLAH